MKRICIAVCVLLALGVLTSVAIAWGRASMDVSRLTSSWLADEPERHESRVWGEVLDQRGRASVRRVICFEPLAGSASARGVAFSLVHIPEWSLAHEYASLVDTDYAQEHAFGWPYHCLTTSWVVKHETGALPDEGLRGGLHIEPFRMTPTLPTSPPAQPAYSVPPSFSGGFTFSGIRSMSPTSGLAFRDRHALPLSPRFGALALNTLFFACAWALAIELALAPKRLRRWLWRRRGRCLWCRYELAGAPLCSECGRSSSEQPRPVGTRAYVGAGLVCVMLVIVLGVLGFWRAGVAPRTPALHRAAAMGDVQTLQRLIPITTDFEAHDGVLGLKPAITSRDALWWAAVRGHTEAVRLLLDAGAKPEGPAVIHAMENEHWEVCIVLVEASESPGFLANNGRNVLLGSVARGDVPTAVRLHRAVGGVPNDRRLLFAASESNGEMLREVLTWATWSDGMLAECVPRAIEEGDALSVVALIEVGADVRTGGRELLWMAWEAEAQEIARTLIAFGADEDPSPSVLHRAVVRACPECYAWLLEAGSDPLRCDQFDDTMAHTAARLDDGAEILAMVLDAGVPMDATSRDGNTPLMEAVLFRQAEAVRLLLKRGADPSRTNRAGLTALDLASLPPERESDSIDAERVIVELLERAVREP